MDSCQSSHLQRMLGATSTAWQLSLAGCTELSQLQGPWTVLRGWGRNAAGSRDFLKIHSSSGPKDSERTWDSGDNLGSPEMRANYKILIWHIVRYLSNTYIFIHKICLKYELICSKIYIKYWHWNMVDSVSHG